jgi:hypothetical protein
MKYLSLFTLVVLLLSCNNKKEITTDNVSTEPTLTDQVTKNNEMDPIVYDSIISIAELYKNKEKYNNAIIKLRGKVTKYNPGILNINWVHIQDGTEFEEEKDVTLTTLSTVKMGDTVSFKGKVSLEKDLGAGYIYDVLVENATIE